MKKIGILGGIGWPSTAEYYAGLCRLAELHHSGTGNPGPAKTPEMAIEALDLAKAAALLGSDDDEASWSAFDSYHRAGLQRLERSSAELAVIACNTAHHRFDQITRGIAIPVLSILDVATDACIELGVKEVLILGTLTVMTSKVIREAFRLRGIDSRGPDDERHRRAVLATIDALERGRIDGAAGRIHEVVVEANAGRERDATAVCLGCTELPLAFPANKRDGVFECNGIRYVNTAALHVRAAFERALEET